MTDTAEQKVAPVFHDAGSGHHVIIAFTGEGKHKVFLSDPNLRGGAFCAWHSNGICLKGAEALARWVAEGMRGLLAAEAKAATRQEHEYAGAALGMSFQPNRCDRIAQDFDTAAALMPYLEHAADPWGLAMTIAISRPWDAASYFPDAGSNDPDLPF